MDALFWASMFMHLIGLDGSIFVSLVALSNTYIVFNVVQNADQQMDWFEVITNKS